MPSIIVETPIILLTDESDDKGVEGYQPNPESTNVSQIEYLVERGLDDVSGSGVDFFFNIAEEALNPGESIKYEPGGDFFQHMLDRCLWEEKEMQHILDQLEVSKQKQAQMEAAMEKQREESHREERMAVAIRAKLQVQMKADLAVMLSQSAQITHFIFLPPLQIGFPKSSFCPRIEDTFVFVCLRILYPCLIQLNYTGAPLLGRLSMHSTVFVDPCTTSVEVQEAPKAAKEPTSSPTRGPMEYPQSEDTTLDCGVYSSPTCSAL